MNNGRCSQIGVNEKNAMVLLSNFDVDASGGDGSLEPNSTYTDWSWTLIQNSKTGSWIVAERDIDGAKITYGRV